MRVPLIGLSLIGLLLASGCEGAVPAEEDWRESLVPGARVDATEAAPPHEIIHAPLALEGIPSGLQDQSGREIPIACSTCHGMDGLVAGPPRPEDTPGGPHAGLEAAHGDRPCTACHDTTDASLLHLADGTTIPMTEAMQLCAQCHGTQYRDFQHGTHGGMRGYWDSSRGPRLRNHCVDCHDPHRPAFPAVTPMPPPRDRFRPASGDHASGDHHAEADHAAASDAPAGEGPSVEGDAVQEDAHD